MSAIIEPDIHNYRDHLSMMDAEGKRKWIFAKQPKGYFYSVRTVVSFFYLLLFFGLPWIQYKGQPLVLFQLVERRFVIFGVNFDAQDLIVFGLAMLTFVVFIVLFTVVFGRLFCGWACPQTIFMEMVFRKIEYWIDGDAHQQRLLKQADWSTQKIIKRAMKYIAFFLLSFAIANTFLSYIIGLPALQRIITEPIALHWQGLSVLLLFTTVFFIVYAFFREQICIVACPYGRLQGVMLDKKSIAVAYDYVRGEPRGKYQKANELTDAVNTSKGDCIDCHACVVVCPTGIDIRNGIQLECINCTACIDACNTIMEKINKPKGLIRYASEENIATGKKLSLTPRIIAYSLVLLVLIGILAFTVLSHSVINVSLLRTRGQFYQEHKNDSISNLYNLEIANKGNEDMNLHLILKSHKGRIEVIGHQEFHLAPGDKQKGQLFIYLAGNQIKHKMVTLEVDIYDGEKWLKSIQTSFMGPIQ